VDLAEAGIDVEEPAEPRKGEEVWERGIGGETARGRWKIAGSDEGLAVAVRIGVEDGGEPRGLESMAPKVGAMPARGSA
jgi:hypothetical protein